MFVCLCVCLSVCLSIGCLLINFLLVYMARPSYGQDTVV